jgi:toxin ParE1/3/4
MISQIVLSPAAEADIIDIFVRGITSFGLSQADTYEAMLRQAIETELVNHPYLGVARPELGREIRCLYRGAHHIYYCAEGTILKIVRILPDRMNVEREELALALRKLGQSGPPRSDT